MQWMQRQTGSATPGPCHPHRGCQRRHQGQVDPFYLLCSNVAPFVTICSFGNCTIYQNCCTGPGLGQGCATYTLLKMSVKMAMNTAEITSPLNAFPASSIIWLWLRLQSRATDKGKHCKCIASFFLFLHCCIAALRDCCIAAVLHCCISALPRPHEWCAYVASTATTKCRRL